MTYPCTGCGICCRRVGQWVEAARNLPQQYIEQNPEVKEIANFPHAISSNGSCSQLNQDNTCKVYGTRPDICSIKKTWEKYHQNRFTEQQYYEMAAVVCNGMIEAEGLDEKYKVKI